MKSPPLLRLVELEQHQIPRADHRALVTNMMSKHPNEHFSSVIYYQYKTLFATVCTFLCFTAQPLLAIYLYIKFFLFPLVLIAYTQSFESVQCGFCFSLGIIYTIYWIISYKWPIRGGIDSRWFREWALWRWTAEYFPAKLVVSDEMKAWGKKYGRVSQKNGQLSVYLPTNVNYLAGYHPHGPLSTGSMATYGNDSLGFSRTFPGIRRHIATLNLQFAIPIYRDYCMLGGGVSVSREGLLYLLDKDTTGKSGNMVAVSVGGAREALESRPGNYNLVLSQRRGFFRLALETGSYLVPSIGFGETNMYDQVANPESSVLRKLQVWFTRIFTVAPTLYYSTRIIPYRRPIFVVVGRPIMCKRIANPTGEEVNQLREEYKGQLVQMFNKYRPLYDPTADDIRFI
ncbi:hypothetical protein Aperf_G00000051539 [Anoplocephala perfoliata]